MDSGNGEKLSGEELFDRFLSGDKQAFEYLVALYENELFLFLNGIVHDYHEAKHLMIEAFALLALKGGQFAGKSSLKTYLFTIGKNLASKYLKKRKKEQHISYEDVIEPLVDEGETPESFMVLKENKQYLQKAMAALSEDYRVVLMLLYFEDMSYEDAAAVLSKNVRQIKNLVYRAKQTLKSTLEKGGFIYENI